MLIGLIPLGIDCSAGNNETTTTSLKVIFGPAKISLLPKKPHKKKKSKQKKPKKVRKKDEAEPGKKPKKPNPLFDNLEDIFSLIRIALKALSRFRRRLTVNHLMLHLVSGASDPYDAVMQFGKINSLLGSVDPLVERSLHIKNKDVGTAVDFGEDHIKYDFRLKLTIRIWQILAVGILTEGPVLRHLLRVRHRRKQKEKAAAEKESNMKDHHNEKEGNT